MECAHSDALGQSVSQSASHTFSWLERYKMSSFLLSIEASAAHFSQDENINSPLDFVFQIYKFAHSEQPSQENEFKRIHRLRNLHYRPPLHTRTHVLTV